MIGRGGSRQTTVLHWNVLLVAASHKRLQAPWHLAAQLFWIPGKASWSAEMSLLILPRLLQAPVTLDMQL